MPRKKRQTHEKNKPSPEEQTPFQKFEELARKLVSVPKDKVKKDNQ